MNKYLRFNLRSFSSLLLLYISVNNSLPAFPVFQSQTDTTANQYFEIAESLYRTGDYEISSYNYLKAAEIFKADEMWNEYLRSVNYAGINLRYIANYKESLKILRDGLILGLKKFGEQNLIVADLYNSLGTAFYDQGNLSQALPDYEKSLQICLDLFGEENKNTARGYHNVGLIYYWLGDADKALDHFNKALAIWLKTIGDKNASIGNCFINLANTYFLMEDFDKSLEYDLKALETWKSVLGEKHQFIAMSYNNLAQTYETLGKDDLALSYDKKALQLRKILFGDAHPEVGYSLAHVAKVYMKKAKFDSSYAYYREALKIYKNYPPQYSYRLESLLGLAELNLLTGEYDSAMQNYDTILVYSLPKIFSPKYSVDSLNLFSSKVALLSAVAGKGDVFYKKYFLVTGGLNDLQDAYVWYLKYADILRKIKKSYRGETSKLLAGENLFSIESRLIKTSLELFKITGDKNYEIQAFRFAEESKAGTLLDAIAESGAKRYSGIPDSLIQKESKLKKELAFIETKIQENEQLDIPISEMSDLTQRAFDLNAQYEKLIDLFEQEYPQYYKLKYSQSPVSVKEIQNHLLTGSSVFVEYFISDSSYYVFTIDNGGLGVYKLTDGNIANYVLAFRNSLENLDFNGFLDYSEKLYSLLIQPIKDKLINKKRVYIVPDGVLNYLPFEALVSAKTLSTNSIDFSKLAYLINDYEICYSYSASLILNNNPGENINSFVGFAPVFPDKEKDQEKIDQLFDKHLAANERSVNRKDKTFSSLPESEKEVNAIKNLFSSSGRIGRTFTYESASERNLKSDDILRYNCLHLATHGFINDDKPKLSGLLFAGDSSKIEDGVLYSEEIFTLSLRARLVILSACESGLGKLKKGEGILGLTRGFLYAGPSNVVVSLWQVADESTSDLMINFYTSLLAGNTISASLREAKLKLIKEKKFSYPLEWAPFVLIGSN